MNNLSSYFGLIGARMSASDKDLHVPLMRVYHVVIAHKKEVPR